MLISLFFVFIIIIWIILGTSTLRLNPFIVLLVGVFALGLLLGLPLLDITQTILNGFVNTLKSIGLLIVFGTLIGAALELSGGAHALANGLLKFLHKLPLPLAISCIGYVVSIPVFCDAAFVILAQLNKSLAQKTKTSLVGLSVALSTGLFAPHVLIPPTPGPLAAAANLNLNQLSLLIITGGIIGFILILVGGSYALYVSKKYPYVEKDTPMAIKQESINTGEPSFGKSILPILLPLFLMCLGAFLPKNSLPENIGSLVSMVSKPEGALGIGLFFALILVLPKGTIAINQALQKGIKQALPILLITAMGGALGKMIGHISLDKQLADLSQLESLGLLVPFLIAAFLKTAQGSSTVAIITAASIVFPLLPLLELNSEMGKVWVIMAIGTGAMTISHANDSYFWIVSQMSGMDVKTAYKTHTLGTLIQGTIGIVVVLIGYYGWLWFV